MKKRMNAGSEPSDHDEWLQIGEIEHLNRRWFLWRKRGVSQSGWVSLKLFLDGKSKGKANYNLSFSIVENRLANSSESFKLLNRTSVEFANSVTAAIHNQDYSRDTR